MKNPKGLMTTNLENNETVSRTHLKTISISILAIVFVISVLVLLTPSAMGDTIVVPDDYDTIQYAIENASGNDTIRVYAGTYVEDVIVDYGTTLHIIGNGTTETIIRADSAQDAVVINANGSSISKLNIQEGSIACMMIRGHNVTVEDILVNGSGRGIRTNGAEWLYIGNSTIWNNTSYGMIIASSTDNLTIYGCIIDTTGDNDGIKINSGHYNMTISHTTMNNSAAYGIEVVGASYDVTINNCIFTNNTLNGADIDNVRDVIFTDNRMVSNIDFGVKFTICANILVDDNTITYNGFGMYFEDCDNAEVSDNVISHNTGQGMTIYAVDAANPHWIHHNTFENNSVGIEIHTTSNHHFEDNDIIENAIGIKLRTPATEDNVIRQNTIEGNDLAVENVDGAKGNIFYHNNFIDNTALFTAPDDADVFDNGYPSGGNYWDTNYTGEDNFRGHSQDLPGSDGIGDTPFNLSDNSSDRYPLMSPWEPPIEDVPDTWVADISNLVIAITGVVIIVVIMTGLFKPFKRIGKQ